MRKLDLMRRLNANGYLLLIFLSLLYLLFEFTVITLPAFYCDEAMSALGVLDLLDNVLPSKGCSEYRMAGESYLVFPFVKAFGLNVYSLRSAMILYGLLILILVFLFVKEFFNKNAALLAVALLVSDYTFLIIAKMGLFYYSLLELAMMGSLFFIYRWYSRRSTFDLVMASFCLGAGFSIHIIYSWYFAAFCLAALLFGRTGAFKKHVLAFRSKIALGFTAGAGLLLCYNIVSPGGIIDYILQNPSPNAGLSFLHRISVRFDLLRGMLSGRDIYLSNPRCQIDILRPEVMAGLTVLLLLLLLFRKTVLSPRRIMFVLVLTFGTIVFSSQSPILLPVHQSLYYPLIYISAGIALFEVCSFLTMNGLKALACGMCVFFVGAGLCSVLISEYVLLKNTDMYPVVSPASYELTEFIKKEDPFKIICLDWGFHDTLLLLCGWRINDRLLYYGKENRKKEQLDSLREAIAKGGDVVFLLYASDSRILRSNISLMKEETARFGRRVALRKTFYGLDGRDKIYCYALK